MTDQDATSDGKSAKAPARPDDSAGRKLSPAGSRALAEAEERRKAYLAQEAARPKEIGGRGGNDPHRYGDWEVKGLTSDF